MIQPTLFDAGHVQAVSEIQIRNEVLHDLGQKYETQMDEWRARSRHYLYRNQFNNKYRIPWAITIEDVRVICDIEPDPANLANKKLGALFSGDPDSFQWTGHWHVSQTPGCHGRPIKIWTLSDKKFMEKFGRIPGGAVRAPKDSKGDQNGN